MESGVARMWSGWRDLTGVICNKKVPTKMNAMINKTEIQQTLLHGFETCTKSAREKVNVNNRDEYGAMGNGCEPTGTSEK